MSDLTVVLKHSDGTLRWAFTASDMLLNAFYGIHLEGRFPEMNAAQPVDTLFLSSVGAGGSLRAITQEQWTQPLSAFLDHASSSDAPPTVTFLLNTPAIAHNTAGSGVSSSGVTMTDLSAMISKIVAKIDVAAKQLRFEVPKHLSISPDPPATITELLAINSKLNAIADLLVKKQRFESLKRLMIPPDASVCTTTSTSTAETATSDDEKHDFKARVVDYYGLWADPEKTIVYPMLQQDHAVPQAIPFQECELCHVWGKGVSNTPDTAALAVVLDLPDNFLALERSYMIYRDSHEEAYEHDAFTLHPGKDATGAELIRVKVGPAIDTFIDAAAQADVRLYDGTLLYLPNGNKPFLRLLGWRTISAYRRWFEDKDGVEPPRFDINTAACTGDLKRANDELQDIRHLLL